MGERHHKNFIKAFTEFNKDGFVPDNFYLWSAISLVATVLERKVWTRRGGGLTFYPHMYVFLVARPGIGKSTAMKPTIKILQKMNESYGTYINILPNKVTEPKLLDILANQEYFTYNDTQIAHTSAFFYASEASACFNDPYGGFTQTITALYDGDDISKATVSRNKPIHIINPCINILAGCTFDYLSRLLTQEGILGGFASRITYVVHDEFMERESKWNTDVKFHQKNEQYMQLVADLYDIHQMVGEFKATPEYIERWNDWFPVFDKKLQETQNEKLQALMVRKQTAMQKLPMILSAAESSDLILRAHHWDLALELMNRVEEKIPSMIREGQAQQTTTQSGYNAAIFKKLEQQEEWTEKGLVSRLMYEGHNPDEIRKTLATLCSEGSMVRKIGDKLKLVGNPNLYL